MRRLFSKEALWLMRQMRPLWRLQVLSVGSILGASLLTLIGPLILKWLIDKVMLGPSQRLLWWGILGFGVSVSGQLALTYAGYVLSYLFGEKLAFQIRFKILRSLHRVSAAYCDRVPLGEIQYRLEQDVTRLGELGSDILASVLRMVITAVVILTTLVILNFRLTLLMLPLLPLFYLLQRRYFAELRSAADAAQTATSGVSTLLQEHLAGLIQLQLLNKTEFHAGKLVRIAATGVRARMHQKASEVRFSAASMLVVVLGNTMILGYGGHEVMRGALTVGGLVAFYTYVAQLFGPLSTAVDLQSRMQRVSASTRRVLDVGQENRPKLALVKKNGLCQRHLPPLEFQGVSFTHGGTRRALDSLDLIVGSGERLVLAGHSGCGKSTLVHLAAGLYSPDGGCVRILGLDIRYWGRRSLRSLLALVPQEPVLFDGTVRDNLLYGNPRATSRELTRVLEIADLEGVLQRLPRGLNEELGPQGRRLSGGEKKRVALARAVLQEPRILILDELMGALDGLTTSRIMERLKEQFDGRTVIFVSHRPAMITWATRIVVLRKGKVLDSGSHEQLTQRCLEYTRLYAESGTH